MKKLLLIVCLASSGLLAEESLKVGVYVGEGTHGLGAERWTEIIHFSSGLEEVLLDTIAITNGTFDACAALILPEGDADAMAKALGADGLKSIRTFVEKGGGCLASDGGAHLLTLGSVGHERVNLLPYGVGDGFGVGATDEIHVDYIPELAKTFPIRRANDRRLDWEGAAPFVLLRLEPSELDELASFNIAARFRGNLNLAEEKRATLRGAISEVYGTFGKGRVWATVCHSEYTPSNIDITKMQLEYVLGRKAEWQLPQRKKGQLAVSIVVDGALGVEKARILLTLLDDEELDVAVMTPRDYDGFWLRHSDKMLKASELTAETRRDLRSLRARPEEPAVVLKREKAPDAIKAVLYCGPGVGDAELFNFATILDDSPKYTVECQDGSQIVNGSLKGRDFILVAGGNTAPIYWTLQPGEQALKAWLREGGTYYGACAGSIVTLQKSGNFQTGLGLVPFTYRPSQYRGHSHPTITFNEDAVDWGLDNPVQRVLYWGGPEHLAHEPIEDTDVKVLARFNCESIDTYGINTLEMKDWSAIVGGRIGKGRIVSTAVHPEEEETQFHLVYAGLRYLHGEQPKPTPINRRRGSLAVGYFMPFVCSAEQMSFALELRRDTRFDVRPESEHMDISGYARHLDVYVFGNGFKGKRIMAETDEFFRRGGRGIFVSADPNEREKIAQLTNGYPNIAIVGTYDEVRKLLEY